MPNMHTHTHAIPAIMQYYSEIHKSPFLFHRVLKAAQDIKSDKGHLKQLWE